MGQPTTTLQFANCETAQRFQRSLIARLSDLLSERVGRRRAEAELSHIAELLALELHALRGREDPIPEGDVERLADTLVALKRRIGARFRIVSVTPWQIVLKNSVCPFAEKRQADLPCVPSPHRFSGVWRRRRWVSRACISRNPSPRETAVASS